MNAKSMENMASDFLAHMPLAFEDYQQGVSPCTPPPSSTVKKGVSCSTLNSNGGGNWDRFLSVGNPDENVLVCSSDGALCSSDGDCPGKTCADDPTKSCEENADCQGPSYCEGGLRSVTCVEDSDCNPPKQGSCVAASPGSCVESKCSGTTEHYGAYGQLYLLLQEDRCYASHEYKNGCTGSSLGLYSDSYSVLFSTTDDQLRREQYRACKKNTDNACRALGA